MGSLAKFFAKHIDLLVEAFDIDENSNLIERNKQRVGEADRLVHDLFVNEMRGIMNELVLPRDPDEDENGPHRYKKPRGSDLPMFTNPVVFVPKTDNQQQQQRGSPSGPTGGALGFGGEGSPEVPPGRYDGEGNQPSGERMPAGAVKTPNGPALPAKGPQSGGASVDQSVALNDLRKLAGQPPSVINQYLRANGIDYNSAAGNYCAALANAYQHSIGRPGTGSLVATSVLRYGTPVDAKDVQVGDVGVATYGHRYGETGGHAVTVAGAARQNPTTGEMEIPVISSHGMGAGNQFTGPVEEYRPAASLEFHRWTPNGTAVAQLKTHPQDGPPTQAVPNATPAPNTNGAGTSTPGNLAKALNISPDQWNAYRQGVSRIESADYSTMGGSSGRFAGRYQMGGQEIADAASRLGERPPSTQQFLRDPQMQERYFDNYTLSHHNALMSNPRYANAPPEEKLKVLGYAHNQGAGGASKWLNTGQAGHDAFGTSGTAYYNGVGRNLSQLAQSGNQPNQGSTQTASTQQPAPQQQRPTQVASLGNPQLPAGTGGNTRPLVIGDSLAVGVGGVAGDTRYAHGGFNPEYVNHRLVDQAIANGDVQGKHVILSGGASNAGGNTQMVAQHYPDMLQKLKTAGASGVTVLGVGPYSHYDQYGYNKIIGDSAQQHGVNFTGPLANIAKFNGTDLNGGVHPNDYRPIYQHIQNNYLTPKPPQNVAQNIPPKPLASPAPTPPPDQTASASPPSSGSSRGSSGASQQMASNASKSPPPSSASSTASTGVSSSTSGPSSGSGSSVSGSSSGSSMKMASNDSGTSKTTATESRRRVAIQLLRS